MGLSVVLFSPELLRAGWASQCKACGRLILSGPLLADVLDGENRFGRDLSPAQIIRALAVHLRLLLVDDCASCWHRREAERLQAASFQLTPELYATDAHAADKFYRSSAYRHVETKERARLAEAARRAAGGKESRP